MKPNGRRWNIHMNIEPRGKGSVLVGRRGRFAKAYTAPKDREWSQRAIVQLKAKWGTRPPLQGPLAVKVVTFKKRPQRLNRKKDPDQPMWCDAKPDVDNCLKLLFDAITHAGIWEDDRLVVDVHARTLWAAKNAAPSIFIEIRDVSTVP